MYRKLVMTIIQGEPPEQRGQNIVKLNKQLNKTAKNKQNCVEQSGANKSSVHHPNH